MNAHDLVLYEDFLGSPISTPVSTYGTGRISVVVVCLQHGDEISGLLSLQHCLDTRAVPESDLTLHVIRCANPMGLAEASRRMCAGLEPLTEQPSNLNFWHPGDPEGPLVARVAAVINAEIRRLSPDWVLDLHAAGGEMIPYVVIDHVDDAEMRTLLRSVAASSGVPWFEEGVAGDVPLSRCLTSNWCALGVPALTVELGPRGYTTSRQMSAGAEALAQVLRSLITPPWREPQERWGMATARVKQGRGLLTPKVSAGDMVLAGQAIAELVTIRGDRSAFLSPVTGQLLMFEKEWRAYPGANMALLRHELGRPR